MNAGSNRLSGKTALITGASSGIGAATARLFAAEGAQVALVARRDDAIRDVMSALGDRAIAVVADVSRSADVVAAAERTISEFGRVDIAVNAAGIASPALLEDVTDDNWNEMIAVNLSGTFYVCRELGLRMRAGGGGSIVNLGSELSFLGLGMCSAYCAAKAGVIGLTKAIAMELAPTVRVNAICPGPVDTPMLAGELALFPEPGSAMEDTVKRVPLGRLAQPDEIAEAILFAATAPFATGSAFLVDGGVTSI
jgi:NAD(P)-dependent dehydrogenase (short-subunit alcohol dehydrogenase family)